MRYKDKIYGAIEIKEKLLIDLISTNAIKRLKGVDLGGIRVFLNPKSKYQKLKTNRFEHSLGVCILLRKFKASLKEQTAGLLHDISHTAFSHVVDFLFNRHTQHDYHEQLHDKVVLNSEIPKILEKHGIDINGVLDESKFTLLERDLPDLCADRIDYSFRHMLEYEIITREQINIILNSLVVSKGEFVFVDKDIARIFSEKFIQANKLIWCNTLQATYFHLISEMLRLGFSRGIIKKKDLFSTDEQVYNKLIHSNYKEIRDKLNLISNLKIVEDKENYDMHLRSKIRCIDPKIISDGSLIRLSKIDSSYKKLMDDFMEETSKGFFVRIVG